MSRVYGQSPTILAAALAATLGGLLPAEAIPSSRPRQGRSLTAGRLRGEPHQRLKRASGPGSYDEWKAQLAAERAAKRLLQETQ